jgi:predicted nucleotidyltransferase
MLHPVFESQLPALVKLLKNNKIKSAYAFGSVVSDKFNEDSDIDLLINFEDDVDALESGERWWVLHDALKNTFNREIDLLIESSLKNPYLIEDINEKKQLIYAA